MGSVKVYGVELPIDVTEELQAFEWTRPIWTETRLVAASPFRDDRTPSFFVDLDTGGWGDSGAYDVEWESGNLPKLLSFLRDETYEETCEHLLSTYAPRNYSEGDEIKLPTVTLRKERTKVILAESTLIPYKFRHTYLGNRGISEKVQRFYGVGYSKEQRAVTLPWRHADGSLANIKYRKIHGKTFWYAKGAAPIRTLVYGIDKVYKHGLSRVVLCEAEIDALSWATCGIPAIAIGGTALTRIQLDLIRKSPIETLVLAMDNDKPGEKLKKRLVAELQGNVIMEEISVPTEFKDANDALVAGTELSELASNVVGYYLHDLFNRNA